MPDSRPIQLNQRYARLQTAKSVPAGRLSEESSHTMANTGLRSCHFPRV